jgi:hypothetical protein
MPNGRLKERNMAEAHMNDDIFETAYARVRGCHTDEAWFALSPHQITAAIYLEMRIIDGERVARSEPDAVPMDTAAE